MGQDIPTAPHSGELPSCSVCPCSTDGEHSIGYTLSCSLGVFLIPETFPCVQDHAVPIGIAYQRLQSGPAAISTIAAFSVLLIQRDVF